MENKITENTEQNELPNEDISEQEFESQESSPDGDGDTDDLGDSKWKEGDEVTFVRVRFPGNSRSFPFLVGKRQYAYGQKVVAMSDRGMDVGYINSFPYTVTFKKAMLPIRSIANVANQKDLEEMQGNFRQQKLAEREAVILIDKLGLDMQITHVEIIQFGKKMVFYFTAPARVDFRELVKQLVGKLKMRIELRQISVRDRAAALGSIGACGLATCCSTFLKNYGNVSIKMAKNQNLALIPSKINGVCGQIKCCIKYEDDVYADKRKLLPREGNFVQAKNGDKGKVTKLHILIEQFDMITEKGQIRRYAKAQFSDGKRLGKEYKFPDSFNHVVNETSNVIGLEESAVEMANAFKKNMSEEDMALANIQALKTDQSIVKSDEDTTEQTTSTQETKEERQDTENDKPSPQKRRNRNRRNNRKGKGPKKPPNTEGNKDS